MRINPAQCYLFKAHRRATRRFTLAVLMLLICSAATLAHPLGNFSINAFSRIEVGREHIALRYVIDKAEIPTFQELQKIGAKGDGSASDAELQNYLQQVAADYRQNLKLTLDGAPVALNLTDSNISLPIGNGNLPTLRIELSLTGSLPVSASGETPDRDAAHRLRFEDGNYPNRVGWHETIVVSAAGTTIFDSTAYGTSLSNELRRYPEDMLAAPLAERTAELSFTTGAMPAGATPLRSRDGQAMIASSPDRLAELISARELTPATMLLALLIALGLGAFHALSPGHGKAVVGAYLVGSRGTPRHALFLGLTVTITHTLGVFLLGIVTLFAAEYVLPEQLFPILSFISGLIVLLMGMTLFVRRLRFALDPKGQVNHTHFPLSDHSHAHADVQSHEAQMHSHGGGKPHSHAMPGADGAPISWRSLLALGVSGGLLPCPSALVVMLSAIALQRVAFGLLLVVAFSLGLASMLTGVGLAFLYAGRWLNLPTKTGVLGRVLPAASAFIITCLGGLICYEALAQAGLTLDVIFAGEEAQQATLPAVSVLFLGLIFGVKHAIEADHVAAVTTIVSERKSIFSSAIVGGLWGIGHTITLFAVGIAVILLQVRISERAALALEFGVAIMLVALGANVLRKLMRGGTLHTHPHAHGAIKHTHPHLHDDATEEESTTHHGQRLGFRPVIVGMIHGMAGSAALMLLVLSTIPSPLIGLLYILVFGIGSVGGMMAMSAVVGLPVHLTAHRFAHANLAVRTLAGVFSLCVGFLMMYEIGFVEGLFR